jgi:PAS domain S-box-containing protein
MYFLKDGTERITDFACIPIKDESGKVLFVFATGMDITERVSAERNLHAMHILESITQGFFALDPEWRFTYVNREAQRILARPPNELIGKSIWSEYPGLRGSEFEPAFRKAMEKRVTPSAVTACYEERGRWYDMQVYPVAEGIAVYFRDVTTEVEAQAERERLTAETERQRAMYEAALSNTPDLVYVVDANQRFMYANEALLKMLGKRRDDVVGKDCLELGYPPWHAQMHSQEIEHVVSTRLTVRSEVPFVGPEGHRVYDYILVPVLARDGTVAAVAGTARDITHRKAAEQAIREHAEALRVADRAKDEFLATLAHELRNPLAPLRSALHLLRESGEPDESTSSLIELMERQLDHLIRLVDDLLEMSRITRGTFTLRKERIQLADVLRNAIDTSKPLIESAHHSLSVMLPEEPLWLEGDPVRLAQIVANLLNNAARYTEDRGRICVRAERQGDMAEISVIDTGIGIAPDVLPRVFEMFERGTEIAARGGGLGIGLSLAQRLAAMHGGSVEAHSAGPGKGSRFVVRLPLAAAPGAERRIVERDGKGSAKSSLPRILVVDDNRDAAVTLAMILKSFGAETAIACSGPEALEKFGEWCPSIVFLDIGMPRMDGYEVARRIRAEHPDRRPTLIALTGWGQREDRRKAREAGFDHHIVKPADIRALRDLVTSSSARDTSAA